MRDVQPVESGRRGQTRRLLFMAVVAVMLATVLAASISGGDAPDSRDDHPHASFTFSVENWTVVVTHHAGETVNGSRLYVDSDARGRLGNFAGTAGMACTANITLVKSDSTCRVPDARYETLYVVWEGPGNRSLTFARRNADPTPAPTATPSSAPTPSDNATVTPGDSTPTGTPTDGTPGATGTATGTPGTTTATQTPGNRTTTTPTPTSTSTANGDGTSTVTPGTATQTETAAE